MATVTATNPTYADWREAIGPDGQVSATIELLSETDEMNADKTVMEGNLITGHQATVRTRLPTPTWRKMNGGVLPNKSQRASLTFSCGMLEDYNEVDKAMADLNGNSSAFRMSEARATLEGISQADSNAFFYANPSVNPEQPTGLSQFYNDTTAQSGQNIILGGGAGSDNASIWLIGWSPATIACIVPKNSQMGIVVTDKGQVTIENADGNGGRMEAYRMHFRKDSGLAVMDWRYAVRIPNIDRSLLASDISTGADLPDLMAQAMDRIPTNSGIRLAFYMDRSLRGFWRRQMSHKVKDSTLGLTDVGGVKSPLFQELPVRVTDALNTDEALVA